MTCVRVTRSLRANRPADQGMTLFLVLAALCSTATHSVEGSGEGEWMLVLPLVQITFGRLTSSALFLSFPTNAGCLRGFPDTQPTDSWPDSPTGEVIFADLRFQCNGRLRRIEMMLVFEANIAYNASLQCNFTLWQANGSHYQRSDEAMRTIVVSLASLSLNQDLEERVTFEQSTCKHFETNVDLPIRAGHLVGLSLPPRSSTVSVFNHIPLAVEHDAKSPLIQLTTDDCFSPEQGRFPCPHVMQNIRPAIQVDFVHDSNVNSEATGELL